MKKIFTVIVFAIICAITCDSKSQEFNSLDERISEIKALETQVDALVQEYIDIDIFSGVVLIAVEGNPIYHKAFGLANREKNTPNTIQTRFDIGSMNKSMTKVVILRLVEEGKLSLADTLGKYFDGFPKEASNKVTIAHLLSHTSGYGDYHVPEYWDLPMEEKSMEKAAQIIRQLPLLFEPGTEQEYSNAGYVLLGMIAQKATQTSYFDLVENYITKPLAMENTFLRSKYDVPMRAIGYFKNFKGELRNNDRFQEVPKPDGGFYSTTSDMLKFYRAFHHGSSLWSESARSMDNQFAYYKQAEQSGAAIGHAGGFEGANTVYFEILKDQISILVFANMDEIVAENLGGGILDIIRGKSPEAPSLPATQLVYKAWQENGREYVLEKWDSLTENFHPADPKDLILNSIGYDLLFNDEVKEAVEIFKLNTELFPEIANCWDSYGEGLLALGKKKEALKAYQKALTIRPDLESARVKVEELQR